MTRLGSTIMALVCALGLVTADAMAGELTLSNGDVLRGHVRDTGDFVVLEHPVLGTITIPRADVAKVTFDRAPVPAPGRGSIPAPVFDGCGCLEEELEADPCKKPWDLGITLAVSDDAGNTVKTKVNLDVEAAYRWRRVNELQWRGSVFYEEANDIQTEGTYSSHLMYTRKVSPRGRAFGLWLVDRDDFADILLRMGWFVGYQRDFIRRKNESFSAGIGAGAVTEKREGIDVFGTPALVAQARYKRTFRSGDSIDILGYAVPYLDRTDLSPSRLQIRYAHPIREKVDVTAGFLLDYVPDPPGEIKSYDTKLTFGLRWRP